MCDLWQFYHYAFVIHLFAVFIHCTLCGSNVFIHWSAIEWKTLPLDDGAEEILRGCMARIASLVDSLIVGHVPLGDLKTTLLHKDQFKKLYHHCMSLYSNTMLLNLPASVTGPISNHSFPMMTPR